MSTNLETDWSAKTIQYRLNLPRALHSISPALSALHVSRAAALHPEASAILHPSHCLKCGTYRFSNGHPTHPSTRKKRRGAMSSRPKVLQRSCRLCGFPIDARSSLSLSHSSLPIQLQSGSSKSETVPSVPWTRELSPVDILHPVTRPSPTTTCVPVPPLPDRQSHPRSSNTKTSALKDMLSRDRQREVANTNKKKRKEGQEGLAAFLKEL